MTTVSVNCSGIPFDTINQYTLLFIKVERRGTNTLNAIEILQNILNVRIFLFFFIFMVSAFFLCPHEDLQNRLKLSFVMSVGDEVWVTIGRRFVDVGRLHEMR